MASPVTRVFGVLVLAAACLQPGAASGSDSTGPARSTSSYEVLRLPGGTSLRLAPGTRLKVGKPIKLQLTQGGGPKTLTHTVDLLSGRVEVDLPVSKHPAQAVLVRAPQRVSAVAKGGHSVVIVNGPRVTVGAVTGEMLVALGNDWRPMPAGVIREFSRATYADHAVIASPKAQLSTPILLRVAGTPTQAKAMATPVAHAHSYEFGIWRTQGSERTLLRRESTSETSLELGDLEPGNYGVSVRALEASGLESAESELVPLRVVAAELPEGAQLVDGGILLPPHQRVRLLGTEGVEISYGKASHFVPAPNSIGLIRSQPTLVRLRAAGSTAELPLALDPKTVRADIQIGPRSAQWPNDSISVAIRVTDARGRPLREAGSVKPTVSVNVTPVALDWKRRDNLLTTVVPRPSQPGPWVVRVEVADETGALVGREFLEVSMEAPRTAKR